MKIFKFAAIFIIVCSANVSAQTIDIYERPEQIERSHDFDAQHYRLKLTFDLDGKKLWGENRITLKPLKNEFQKCILDAAGLVVTKVSNQRYLPLKFEQAGQKLTIHFSRAYSYGEDVTFTVEYHAENPEKGLFFSDETDRNPKMVSTDSWPDEARYWFPCYDYPHDKVTMELIVTVDKPNKVLSNGQLIEMTENPDSTVTYHWSQEKPHSTYLSMVAIAPFAVIEDSLGSLPVNYWVYEKDVEDARRIFNKTPYMIDFFNHLYGYEYPWAKYDQVETPTQGGGAEATSATILGQNVIYDRKADKDYSWETIIAHEVAHQWWGDLVTLRTWSETWLNEGFATYSDYLYTRFDKGEDEGAIALLQKKNSYLEEAHNEYVRPIIFTRYDHPGQNFDSHTYPKAACVLHMLRFSMGDEPFFSALQHFLHKYEFQSVDTHDFMLAVKEATGHNMDWFFEQYLYKAGHPVFNVGYQWKENTGTVQLKISQIQDFKSGNSVYHMPVIIGIVTSKGKTSEKVWIKQREETFEFTVNEKPLLVRFDEGNYLLKEWTFEKQPEELLFQLANDDVIGRMWAASELRKFEEYPGVREGLTQSAQDDPFWAVRRSAVETLGNLKTVMDENLLKKMCDDENSKVRASAFRIIGDRRDPKLVSFLMEQFESDDSYLAQAEILRSIGKSGNSSQESFLKKAVAMQSPRNVLKNAAEWALKELESTSHN